MADVTMPPAALIETRLSLAARVAAHLVGSDGGAPLGVAVVGSTALGRCSSASDLDLAAIVVDTPEKAVTSGVYDGVQVDVEWLSVDQAQRDAGRGGWTWELRKSARLGTALPLHDPEGIFDRLAALAAGAAPERDRYAEHLSETEALVDALSVSDDPTQAEAFRRALDMLAVLVLLRTPRRYQKAKWTLDDLIDEGEQPLCGAILDAYHVTAGSGGAALAAARRYIEASLRRAGEPNVATLVAMRYAPDHAAASYVARTLADAEDRMMEGDEAAAHYTACFAARLAATLPSADRYDPAYLACFREGTVTPRALDAARDAAIQCRAWLTGAEVKAAA